MLRVSDEQVKLKRRMRFADLFDRVRTLLAVELPGAWATDATRALDEIEELVEVRHDHVHRLIMMRDGATHGVVFYSEHDDEPRLDAPDLIGMRATSDRLSRIADHLRMLAALPGLERLAPLPGPGIGPPPWPDVPPRYPERDE